MISSRKEEHDLKSGVGNMKHESRMGSNGRNKNLAQLSDTSGVDHKKKAGVKERARGGTPPKNIYILDV